MRKMMWSALIFTLIFIWAWPLFAENKDPFGRQVEREAFDEEGTRLGHIRKQDGRFVFYDKNAVTLERKDDDEWKIVNRRRKNVGKLEKGKRAFKLYDNQANFTGFIIYFNEKGKKRGNKQAGRFKDQYQYTSTVFTTLKADPKDSRLYLYVMDAILPASPDTKASANSTDASKEDQWEVFSEKGGFAGYMIEEKGKIIFLPKAAVHFKKTKKDMWDIYNREETFLGTMEQKKDRVFSLRDKQGQFLGVILSDGKLKPKGADIKTLPRGITPSVSYFIKKITNAKTTPEAVRLYFQVQKVLDDIKS